MMRLALMLVLLSLPAVAWAHEVRPAYLAITQTGPEQFDILWKVPAKGDLKLGIEAVLPDRCRTVAEPAHWSNGGAHTKRWQTVCAGGLTDQTIRIEGLQATMIDALARIEYSDGSTEIARLTPEKPSMQVKGQQSNLQVARTYFGLGFDHILRGVDHLVFVLALILLIRDRWMLVKAITAFTLAHSITLAAASLNLFNLPPRPVEAAIALSIAFVARELVLQRRGDQVMSARLPWLAAFGFGLLHGLGFASALRETGLPQSDVPLALLTFNLGVEAGQLAFVLAVLAVGMLFKGIPDFRVQVMRQSLAYGIGTLAMFWLITRLSAFGLPV